MAGTLGWNRGHFRGAFLDSIFHNHRWIFDSIDGAFHDSSEASDCLRETGMRWTFDFIFGRIYFWGGLGIITYTFFSIAFGLPNLAAGAPVWLTSMLMGLVLKIGRASCRERV